MLIKYSAASIDAQLQEQWTLIVYDADIFGIPVKGIRSPMGDLHMSLYIGQS